MNYNEMLAAGRAMPAKERNETIASLASDARFAALLGLLHWTRNSYVSAVSDQAMAKDHGKLAHCAGSVHGVGIVMTQLRNIIDPPKPSPKPAREEES